MDRYKKKAIAFGSVEEKRNLRFLRKSVDRSNVRHKRLSELRKLEELSLEELPDEETSVKATVPSETSRYTQPSSREEKSQRLTQQEPKKMTYREKLQKWKEEKELKKQLEARKKIPVFKVGRVNPERPASSMDMVTSSKFKEPLKFGSKSAQPSRVALKTPVNTRDILKPVGKVTSRPAPTVSAVSRTIPNPRENLRGIPTTKNNSGQQPASNIAAKSAVPLSRLPGRPGNPGSKTLAAGNSTLSSVVSTSTLRVIKPPASTNCAPKQTPKPQSVATASKIPNQRTGIASRIVPPRSCNKQGTTMAKTNASTVSGLKAPQQKTVPAPKGTKADVEKQKSDTKDEFEDTALVDSICEEKPSGERKKSFAPDDFTFKAPDTLSKFAFPFGNTNFLAMYADMVGFTLPRSAPEDKPTSKTKSEDQKEDSKDEKCKPEVPVNESAKLPEDGKNVAEEIQSVSQPKLRDSEKELDTDPETTVDLAEENSQKERKDLSLLRQLRTISENSPLLTDLELEDNFCGEETYRMRRSRRLASNHFAANASLDPKYLQKTKRASATGSGHLSPLPENSLDSPLASKFSGLSVDSPSEIKQYNFRVRKPEQENRVSLLGSPIRPPVGPRKSIKGDLICFTP